MSRTDTFLENVDWFIDTTEGLLIRLSRFFLMIGFMAGTVAILSSRFELANSPEFNVAWSTVQAVAIDGLLFGVWAQFHRTPWNGNKLTKSWYFFIGVLLGIIAALVNNVISYQELSHMTSTSEAMSALGINDATFSYTRATLVVLVSILVVTLPRTTKAPVVSPSTDITQIIQDAVSAQLSERTTTVSLAVPGDTIPDTAPYQIPEKAVSVRFRDQVKELILSNPSITAHQIAETLSIGQSTAKRHAASIRKELAS